MEETKEKSAINDTIGMPRPPKERGRCARSRTKPVTVVPAICCKQESTPLSKVTSSEEIIAGPADVWI